MTIVLDDGFCITKKGEKMQINMNRQTVRELRDQLQVILDKNAPMQSSMLADLDIQIGNASFYDTEVTFKLSVKVKGSKPKEERDLEEYMSYF